MKFFDRERETEKLRTIRAAAREEAQFTVLQGRRRIGKTELMVHAFGDEPYLYLFVSRAAEAALCAGYQKQVEEFLGESIPGKVTSFGALFKYLMEKSQSRHFTLVIDEFQDFFRVNAAIYSQMQEHWDFFKRGSKMNLVVSGSINTLMNRLFKNSEEPLYGRQTAEINLRPFSLTVMKEILSSYHPGYAAEDLLALWTFTGGVAKYIALFMDNKAYTKDKMLNVLIEEDSYFLKEGWAMLVSEFGKDYGTYFSILSAIASGKTSRAEIMNEVDGDVGGYLTRLETQYSLIAKKQPLGEPTSNKNCLYKLGDNFLRFWFRYIHKYQYLIEVRMFDQLRKLASDDYQVFSGLALEGYFREQFIEAGRYSQIGNWWDKRGENEIDLIGVNEFEHKLDFYEVKRNEKRYNPAELQRRAQLFLTCMPRLKGYEISYSGLSLQDVV